MGEVEENYFDDDDFDEDEFLNAASALERTYTQIPPKEPPKVVPPTSQANQTSVGEHGPPPAKRQRTEDWRSSSGSSNTGAGPSKVVHPRGEPVTKYYASDDDDDYSALPEISVTVDGAYNVHPTDTPRTIPPSHLNSKPTTTSSSRTSHSLASKKTSQPNVFNPIHSSAAVLAKNRQLLPPPIPQGSRRSSSPQPAFPPPIHVNGHANQFSHRVPASSATNAPVRGPFQRQSSFTRAGASQKSSVESPNSISSSNKVPLDAPLGPFVVEELKEQLAMIQNEVASLKQSLKEAEETKLIKEGEASNVRRLMEKQNATHAEVVTRLKAEKQEATQAVKTAETQFKKDLDAVRTQLAFKQHDLHRQQELDVAKRVAWVNVRTGVRSSQRHMSSTQTPRRPSETPRKGKYQGTNTNAQTPKSQTRPRTFSATQTPDGDRQAADPYPSQQAERKQATSPVKKRLDKGKPREDTRTQAMPGSSGLDRSTSQPTVAAIDRMILDEKMPTYNASNISPVRGSPMQEYTDFTHTSRISRSGSPELTVWTVNWRHELHRVIFQHSLPDFTSRPLIEPELTLQMLLTIRFKASTPQETLQTYHQNCGLVLGAFGSHSQEVGWSYLVDDVTNGLIGCASILTQLNMIPPLIPLLDMISRMIVSISDFSVSFLSSPTGESALLRSIIELVRVHLAPPAALAKERVKPNDKVPKEWGWDKQKTDLAAVILALMECLSWVCHADYISRLAMFCRAPTCILNLIDSGQPGWVVERTMRLLVYLGIHSPLFQPLMNISDNPEVILPDQLRVPLLERMCSFLVSPHRWATDVENLAMFRLTATFFASLVEAHKEGIDTLRESRSVIPSLVVSLSRLSARIWEEDPSLVNGTEEYHVKFINTLHPTLHLLWHLVNPSEGVINLRMVIHQASARDPQAYNGLHHLFIVAIGRLSYAPPPKWLYRSGAECLEKMNELARDLLDSVVEGPECDAIWEAYQGDDGDAEEERLRTANQLSAEVNVTDDEEAMAMQMHADMDEEAMEMGMSRSIDF